MINWPQVRSNTWNRLDNENLKGDNIKFEWKIAGYMHNGKKAD